MEPQAATASGATSVSATRGNHPASAGYSLVTIRGPALTYRLLLAAVLLLAVCRSPEPNEIGHALLLTLSHATHGLTNPRIETADPRPLPASQLALLAPDRHRLTVRFSNRPAAVLVTNADFTWTDVPAPAPSPQRARR